jgi:hypothetical protein
MALWEKVFIGIAVGLVMAVAIANAVYLCCGKARCSWFKRKASSKNPPESEES